MLKLLTKIIRDLACDSKGYVNGPKLGVLLGHGVGAYINIHQVTTGGPTEFVFLGYLAYAGGHAAFTRGQSLKYQSNNNTEKEQ